MKIFVPGRICLFGEHSDWAGGYRRINANLEKGYTLLTGTNQGIHAEVKPHPNKLIMNTTLPDGTKKGPFEVPMEMEALKEEAEKGTFFSYSAGVAYQILTHYRVRGLEIDNYVSITSFTNHPMNEECILAIQDNWSWGSSYNVELDDMVAATEYALENGYTVGWSADVSEDGFSFRNGIAINPVDGETIFVSGKNNRNFSDAGAEKKSNAFLNPVEEVDVTPEIRQEGYDNKTTQDDHAMHIVGLYKDQNGTKYFLVKNSWGTGNYPEGYLYVSESYFKWKTILIYLHKDGVSKKMNKQLGL